MEAAGEALEYGGIDVLAQFSDSRLNSGQIIRLLVRPDPFYALGCSI